MMNLLNDRSNLPARLRRSAGCQGMTLIEMLVASCVGVMVLAVVAVLSVYALRSFTAMGNYADLEEKGRTALDQITRDLRQATGVISFNQSGPDKWLRLTNALEGVSRKYKWVGRELVCETGASEHIYLTECDEWNFTLYQRTPMPGSTNEFYPISDPSDAGMCKMIEMSWKCSRTMLGRKWNTESPQSARIVLRTNP